MHRMPPAPRNAEASVTRPRAVSRAAAVVALAVFLTLAGTGVSYAAWTSSATVSGTVGTGEVLVTVDAGGLQAPAFRNDLHTSTGSFNIGNPTSAAGAYSVTLSAHSDTIDNVGNALAFVAWPKSISGCDIVPVAATTGTWAAATPLTGSIAANQTITYCIKTTTADASLLANVAGNAGFSTTVTAKLTIGTHWTASAVDSVEQSTSDIYPTVELDVAKSHVFTNVAHATMCVTLSASGAFDGSLTSIDPRRCTPGDTVSQTWQAQLRGTDNYQLVAADSGLCAQAKSDGNGLENVTCDGTQAQQFTLLSEEIPSP